MNDINSINARNKKLEKLLENHYDSIINYRDKEHPKGNVLHYVVQRHNTTANNLIAIAEKLATNQTIVNAANAIGNTPLFSAIAYKDYDMAKLLLDHGADPNKINNAGLSPLAKASQVCINPIFSTNL